LWHIQSPSSQGAS